MKQVNYIRALTGMIGAAVLVACVTINVYFPEAAAEEAADRFIDTVIGSDEETAPSEGAAYRAPSRSDAFATFNPLDWIFPAAHAQSMDIDINTPAIRAIQSQMERRFDDELRAYFDSGAIGFTADAMIEVRDLSAVGLSERNRLKSSVAADNQDRRAVYREIAVANGHPEWEDQIRATFAERWIARARSGWYYQSSDGGWRQR